jgi:hypothetical protein
MEYIPEKNRDTRYPLWFVRYQCRIPYIQTKTLEDLEQNGLPTSGDIHHDHAMQWEPRLMSLPIHRMAELWSLGANISLVNPKDAEPIFQAISAHLHAWKDHILHAYNPSTPPYDDLLTLDNFANVVYQHAKFAYDRNFVDQHFKISSSTAIGRRAMLASMSRIVARREKDAEEGVLRLRNIDYQDVMPRYDADAEIKFIDYSGKNRDVDAPERKSMAGFFKKGQK